MRYPIGRRGVTLPSNMVHREHGRTQGDTPTPDGQAASFYNIFSLRTVLAS